MVKYIDICLEKLIGILSWFDMEMFQRVCESLLANGDDVLLR